VIGSPLRGHCSPITVAAEAHVTPDWWLHLIAGYLPALIAVAALELGRRAS
jgi:hypothetical protein